MWEINEVPFMEWMKQEGHEVQDWEKQLYRIWGDLNTGEGATTPTGLSINV